MKTTKKNLKLLHAQFRECEAQGMLNSGQAEHAARALRLMVQAAQTKNRKAFSMALNDFARAFCI